MLGFGSTWVGVHPGKGCLMSSHYERGSGGEGLGERALGRERERKQQAAAGREPPRHPQPFLPRTPPSPRPWLALVARRGRLLTMVGQEGGCAEMGAHLAGRCCNRTSRLCRGRHTLLRDLGEAPHTLLISDSLHLPPTNQTSQQCHGRSLPLMPGCQAAGSRRLPDSPWVGW